MRMNFTGGAAIAFAITMAAFSAQAQDGAVIDSAAQFRAWSVIEVDNPRECFAVSQPVDTKALRDGREVKVNRDPMYLFVNFRPSENISGEVSFTAGYPLRSSINVKVAVGDTEFLLNPREGNAFPTDPAADARLIDSFRKGARAIVTGVSSRGTTTVDEFSLQGFTAAYEDAKARCAK